MKYWVPDLKLATQLPPQVQLEEKLGGLPWGLPESHWPHCRSCGKPQSLLAQFIHYLPRLDLGGQGRVLFVFQCNHDPGQCPTWEGGGGSNACLIVEGDALTDRLATPPGPDVEIETEARVQRWLERDDGIPEELGRSFFNDEDFSSLPDEVIDRVATGTRLGGVPSWVQSADEGPGHEWRFVAQLDSVYSFYSPVPDPDHIGSPVGRRVDGEYLYDNPAAVKHGAPSWAFVDDGNHEGRIWTTDGPDFGDVGIGYVFVKPTSTPPEGWFFWQCS